jgi:hypothetical protein
MARLIALSVLCFAGCAQPQAPEEGATPSDRDAFGQQWIALYETKSQREAEETLRAMRKQWVGKRVSWDVQIIEPFCRTAAQDGDRGAGGTCNVRAFDYARLPASAHNAIGGAMPLVELQREEYLELTRQCLPHGNKCVARIEATLASLAEDTDAPMQLRFTSTRLVQVRAAREDEHFERAVRPRVMGGTLSRSTRSNRS